MIILATDFGLLASIWSVDCIGFVAAPSAQADLRTYLAPTADPRIGRAARRPPTTTTGQTTVVSVGWRR